LFSEFFFAKHACISELAELSNLVNPASQGVLVSEGLKSSILPERNLVRRAAQKGRSPRSVQQPLQDSIPCSKQTQLRSEASNAPLVKRSERAQVKHQGARC
jgi:hypothetical protein